LAAVRDTPGGKGSSFAAILDVWLYISYFLFENQICRNPQFETISMVKQLNWV
jgi:hypothetical protein